MAMTAEEMLKRQTQRPKIPVAPPVISQLPPAQLAAVQNANLAPTLTPAAPVPAYRTVNPALPLGQTRGTPFQQTPTPVNPVLRAPQPAAVQLAGAPAAPVSAPAAIGRAAGQVASTAGTVARMGAAPVATVPGRIAPRTAPGQRGGAGALLAMSGLLSAADSKMTPTSAYEQRLGLQPGQGNLGRDLAVRTAGTLSDFGADLVDSTVIPVGNALARLTGVGNEAPTLRSQFADSQAQGGAGSQFERPTGVADFSNVVSGGGTAAQKLATPESVLDQPGGAPSANRPAGTASGSFTGANGQTRTINADGTVNGMAAPNVLPAYTGKPTAAQQLSAPSVAAPDGRDMRRLNEQLDKQISDLGPLDRRSKRDLVGQILGLKSGNVRAGFDGSKDVNLAQAKLTQETAEAQLGADVNREQIASTEKNARRQNTQTITAADGTVYALNGTTLTPITAGGQPFKTATKADTSQQELAAEILKSSLGNQMAGAEQDMNALVAQATQAAAMLAGGGAPAAGKPVSKEQFLAATKAQNPGVSEEELTAYYQQTYGK